MTQANADPKVPAARAVLVAAAAAIGQAIALLDAPDEQPPPPVDPGPVDPPPPPVQPPPVKPPIIETRGLNVITKDIVLAANERVEGKWLKGCTARILGPRAKLIGCRVTDTSPHSIAIYVGCNDPNSKGSVSTDDVEVAFCELDQLRGRGISLGTPKVVGAHVHHIKFGTTIVLPGTGDGEGEHANVREWCQAGMGLGADKWRLNSLWEYLLFTGNGIDAEDLSIKSSGNTVRFVDNRSTGRGVSHRHGGQNVISNVRGRVDVLGGPVDVSDVDELVLTWGNVQDSGVQGYPRPKGVRWARVGKVTQRYQGNKDRPLGPADCRDVGEQIPAVRPQTQLGADTVGTIAAGWK